MQVTLGGKDANCAAASGPSLSLRANSAPTPSPQASLDGGQAATGHQKTPDSRIEVIFQFVATVNCADHADCVAQLAIEYDSTNAGLSSVRGALLSCGEDGSGFEVVAARCFQKCVPVFSLLNAVDARNAWCTSPSAKIAPVPASP
jgi:hypothetical protein